MQFYISTRHKIYRGMFDCTQILLKKKKIHLNESSVLADRAVQDEELPQTQC